MNVIAAPSFTKAFGAATVPFNGSTSLSFTITNNSSIALNNVGFTDALPSGLIVAATPNQTGTCGVGTITATAGAGTISLTGATLAANATCTFGADVIGTTAGVKNNSVTLSMTETGNTAPTATASVTVNAQPTAAAVTICGRVATASGRGISRAVLTLTDSNGNVRYAITNPFGYYRFAGVSAGQAVVLNIKAKRYQFAQPTSVLQVNESGWKTVI